MFGAIMSGLGAIASPVAKIFQKKQERKKVRAQLEGKAKLAQIQGKTDITLEDQEWEEVMAQQTGGTWKDEYVTLIITSPIVLVIIGAVYGALSGDYRMLDGTSRAMNELKAMELDMGYLMTVVVTAAVGLKVWRKA